MTGAREHMGGGFYINFDGGEAPKAKIPQDTDWCDRCGKEGTFNQIKLSSEDGVYLCRQCGTGVCR